MCLPEMILPTLSEKPMRRLGGRGRGKNKHAKHGLELGVTPALGA